MRSITLKNVPDDLHQRLKDRAARHHRSLNSEILASLEAAVRSVFYDVAGEPVNVLAILPKSRAAQWLETHGVPNDDTGSPT